MQSSIFYLRDRFRGLEKCLTCYFQYNLQNVGSNRYLKYDHVRMLVKVHVWMRNMYA